MYRAVKATAACEIQRLFSGSGSDVLCRCCGLGLYNAVRSRWNWQALQVENKKKPYCTPKPKTYSKTGETNFLRQAIQEPIFLWLIQILKVVVAMGVVAMNFTSGNSRYTQHKYISDLDRVSTPQLFYAYFYNHARRLRLEKLLYLEPSRSSNGFF
jgi:hypothetical protein